MKKCLDSTISKRKGNDKNTNGVVGNTVKETFCTGYNALTYFAFIKFVYITFKERKALKLPFSSFF